MHTREGELVTKVYNREFDVVILESSPRNTEDWVDLQTLNLNKIEITKRLGKITGVTLEFPTSSEIFKFGYQEKEIRFLIFESVDLELDEKQTMNACLIHLKSWSYSGNKIKSLKDGVRTTEKTINLEESINILDRITLLKD